MMLKDATLKHIQVKPHEGLQKTISLMNELEKIAFQKPQFVKFVHENFSSDCLACIPGKIWKYIQNNFEYKKDDPFDEFITAPYYMPELKQGDCDDFSLFAKTVIDILGGFNSNYILFGKERGSFSHIAVFVNRGIINGIYVDPVVIDGANKNFNLISTNYKYYKII